MRPTIRGNANAQTAEGCPESFIVVGDITRAVVVCRRADWLKLPEVSLRETAGAASLLPKPIPWRNRGWPCSTTTLPGGARSARAVKRKPCSQHWNPREPNSRVQNFPGRCRYGGQYHENADIRRNYPGLFGSAGPIPRPKSHMYRLLEFYLDLDRCFRYDAVRGSNFLAISTPTKFPPRTGR